MTVPMSVTTPSGQRKPASVKAERQRLILPVTALLLILLVNAVLSPGFFALSMVDGHLYGSLVDILHRGAPLALLAIGMSIVIGTGGIDLSVGAIIAICGSVMAVLIQDGHLSSPLIALLTLGCGLLCGLWNGVLVAVLRIQPIVATLILMVAGRGIAQMITGGQIVTFHSDVFGVLGSGYLWLLPMRVILTALVLIALIALIRRTALGLFIEAVGGNSEASRLAGIESRSVLIGAYMLSGFCAACAGMIIAADISGADANNAGLWLEMDAILAVVIGGASLAGGRFYLGLTLLGTLVIQSLTTSILVSGLPAQYTLLVKAVVIIVFLLIQSTPVKTRILRVLERRSPAAKKGENA